MAKKIDMIGNTYGRLRVIEEAPYRISAGRKKSYVKCLCSYGKEKIIRAEDLRRKRKPVLSCGCLMIEKIKKTVITHNMSKSKTYKIWCGLKTRCNNPKSDYYYCYGGKGISYDSTWEYFENFLRDMGECPEGFSIERKDINKNYTKSNCEWIPLFKQSRNTSTTKLTEALVTEMRKLYQSGIEGTRIAEQYKQKFPHIGYSTIEQAVYGTSWKNK